MMTVFNKVMTNEQSHQLGAIKHFRFDEMNVPYPKCYWAASNTLEGSPILLWANNHVMFVGGGSGSRFDASQRF